MKKLFLLMFLMANVFFNICINCVAPHSIKFSTSEQEKVSVEKIVDFFEELDISDEVLERLLQDILKIEETNYQKGDVRVILFHALLDEQFTGVAFCDLLDEHRINVRLLMIDPELCTAQTLKDVLTIICRAYPEATIITVTCLDSFQEMVRILKAFGFISLESANNTALPGCSSYELRVNSKCQICDLLYPNIWSDELDDEAQAKELEQEDLGN